MSSIAPILAAGLLVASAGPAPGAEPAGPIPPAGQEAISGDPPVVEALLPAPARPFPPPEVSVVMDTLRVTAAAPQGRVRDPRPDPPRGAETPRDPRREPLFVTYARPVQLMGLADRLDLDRVRWRYAPSACGK